MSIAPNSTIEAPNAVSGPHSAFALQGQRKGRRHAFGIYTPDGSLLPHADIAGRLAHSVPEENVSAPRDLPLDERPTLFAGLLPQQFGHVILNSLGRLWALEQLPKDTRVLYLPRRAARLREYPFLRPLLDMLGVHNAIGLHAEPMRYSQIYMAQDHFGERHLGRSNGIFRDWVQRKLPVRAPVSPGRKIYVTRSKLAARSGKYCNETLLEDLLAADGYEIFAPETVSLCEQIETFQGAEKLIFAESSALHLYALVARAEQEFAVLQRRPKLPELLLNQLGCAATTKFFTINAIQDIFWLEERADNLSRAVLDFETLRSELLAAGFLSPKADWRGPTDAELQTSLRSGLKPGESLIPDKDRPRWIEAWRNKKHQRQRQII